ncbi:MAG: hypothetical protein K5669_02435 [Lachnospiraceae bacterium]|nr:hypothetical protein [Lachnospiraceae bacterium]
MENKVRRLVTGILSKIIILGFAAQIVFGIIYVIKNIGYVQMFGDSAANVAVSGSFSCNIYTGVLYPAILLVIRLLGMATGISWYSVMYVLQLALSVCAGFFLVHELGPVVFKKYFALFSGFAIATFPLILQSSMAILPNSFALSFLMLEIAMVSKYWNGLTLVIPKVFSFEMGHICLFWLLAALTNFDFLFIGAIPAAAILIRALRYQNKLKIKKRQYPIIIFVLFAVLIVGLYNLASDKTNPVRPQKSIEVALFDRVAWKELSHPGNIRYWIIEVIGDDAYEEVLKHRESMKTLAEPMIEEKLGVKESKKFYMKIVKDAIQTNYGDVLHDTFADFAGYAIPPVITKMTLEKTEYLSYTPRNYDVFMRNAPKFSKYYMDYSLFWFGAAGIIGAVLWMMRIQGRLKGKPKGVKIFPDGKALVVLCVVMGVLIAIINTFSGSCVYDYKAAGFSNVLLLLFIIFSVDEKRELYEPFES